jgi:hypothetical protein
VGRARYFLVAVATALAACGDDAETDVARAEGELAGIVEQQTGTEDVVVSCPDDVGEGDVCDVAAPGGVRAQVRVTRLDEDAVEGQVVQP